MTKSRHTAVFWPLAEEMILHPMNAGRRARGPHAKATQARWDAEDERERKLTDRIVARDAMRPRHKPMPHVAKLSVVDRYLRYLRGGPDQRWIPGEPFGAET